MARFQWLWWLAIALVAGVIEVVTLDFFFVMIAGGALAAALVAGLGGNFVISLIVFCVVSVALLFGVRPILLTRIKNSAPDSKTNADALIGKKAEVISEVTDRGGQIKLVGEVWSAKSAYPGAVFSVGQEVQVASIDGATAVVADAPSDRPPFETGYGPPGGFQDPYQGPDRGPSGPYPSS